MREIVYKLPYEFLHRLERLYPHHHQKILNTFLVKKLTTFRINYAKIDLVGLRRLLLSEHVRFQELTYPRGAFVSKTPLRDVQETQSYRSGAIYVQNVSSMLPVLVMEPAKGEKILDLCAAPGAKTAQIFSLAPGAEITALERDRIRYHQLLTNLRIQGVTGARTMLIDGIWARKKFPEYFDKILIDAPCTAEGLFLLQNPRTYKFWKEKKVREIVHTQKDLLQSAFYALKEGGTLVYSTCTFSPEENEGVIDWFFKKFSGKISIVPSDINLPNVFQGVTQWHDKRFSPELKHCRRIIPNEYMEGFFVAKLKKIGT